jgi:hypothetical protein
MIDFAIGVIFIFIGVYGLKDYNYYKKLYADDPVPRQGNRSFGFGIILMVIVGLAFILKGLGFKWW